MTYVRTITRTKRRTSATVYSSSTSHVILMIASKFSLCASKEHKGLCIDLALAIVRALFPNESSLGQIKENKTGIYFACNTFELLFGGHIGIQ